MHDFCLWPFVAQEPPERWVFLAHVDWVNGDPFQKLPLPLSPQGPVLAVIGFGGLCLAVELVGTALEGDEANAQAGTVFRKSHFFGWCNGDSFRRHCTKMVTTELLRQLKFGQLGTKMKKMKMEK